MPSVVVLRLVHSGDYLERIIKSTQMSRKKRNEMGVMIHSDREVDEDDEDDMLLGWDSAAHSASDEQSEDNEDSDDEDEEEEEDSDDEEEEEDSDDDEEEEENSEEESDRLVRERRTAQVEKKGRKSVKSSVRRSRSSRDTKPGRKKRRRVKGPHDGGGVSCLSKRLSVLTVVLSNILVVIVKKKVACGVEKLVTLPESVQQRSKVLIKLQLKRRR